jgi:signal transduction histidine kinase
LHPVLTTVRACLETAVETVTPALAEKQQTLTVTDHSPDLVIRADPARITQCLVNVLNNAVKFTPPAGSIVVAITTAPASGAQSVCVMIQITDSGMGISPELLPQLFEMFVQGERILNRAHGGLGVGLALCRRMIEMHGGQISAASEGLNRGSTFTLSLPLA